jgi:antitoxin MazE
MQAVIQKWGNSQGIRIPKAFLEAMNMKENDTVEISRTENNIIISKVKSELTLDDIFEGYDYENSPEQYDWGSPVGREIW